MAEWLIAAVLKTADRKSGPRVRIPESPFGNKIIWSCGRVGYATLLLQGESERSDTQVRILPRPFGRCGVIGKRIRFKPGWGDTRVGSNPIICMPFAERLAPLLHLAERISGRNMGNDGTRSAIKTFRRTAVTSRLRLEKLCDILFIRDRIRYRVG